MKINLAIEETISTLQFHVMQYEAPYQRHQLLSVTCQSNFSYSNNNIDNDSSNKSSGNYKW